MYGWCVRSRHAHMRKESGTRGYIQASKCLWPSDKQVAVERRAWGWSEPRREIRGWGQLYWGASDASIFSHLTACLGETRDRET